MAGIVNTEQAAAWNGYEGEHWAEHAARWDAVVGGTNAALFAAADIGGRDRVLDVGCGTGATTRLAALRASRGHALGVDLSAPMLARARAAALAEGVANVSFEQADAQVHPFAEGGFDVAVSRGSAMFFADPVAAFANIARALRPGGRLAFTCPQEVRRNDWFTVPMAALLGAAPDIDPAAPYEPGMFSLADPRRTARILTEAGWRDVNAAAVEVSMDYGTDAADAAAFLMSTGPVQHLLRDAGQDGVDRGFEAVSTALRPYEKDGAVRLTSSWWQFTATR